MIIELFDFHNFGSGKHTWFHPAVTLLQDGAFFATMQKINGSDHYEAPAFAISTDHGRTWTEPAEIPPFRSRVVEGTPFVEGVADIRPFTLQDGTVAVFGCTTFYTDKGCASWDKRVSGSQPPGCAVYALWSPVTGRWSERGTLGLPGMKRTCRTACTQAVLLEQDQIILPMYLDSGVKCDYFGQKVPRFASLTAVFRKDDDALEYVAQSNLLEIPVLRGCIEPSMVRLADGTYAMTLRAENGRMYRALSSDALEWQDLRPWTWDDGGGIETASTQQHWLRLKEKTFLVYTRRDGGNENIMRFRAPLYIAEADAKRATLLRSSEKVLFPKQNINGTECLYGNFHCAPLNDDEALVTDAALHYETSPDGKEHARTIVMAAMVR